LCSSLAGTKDCQKSNGYIFKASHLKIKYDFKKIAEDFTKKQLQKNRKVVYYPSKQPKMKKSA